MCGEALAFRMPYRRESAVQGPAGSGAVIGKLAKIGTAVAIDVHKPAHVRRAIAIGPTRSSYVAGNTSGAHQRTGIGGIGTAEVGDTVAIDIGKLRRP